ncbi:hypothetical protein B0H19DRAFT_1059082 [Mycena capillaripes]|nr:hypothetical protein B0H19DRAFT_1059082 [Mycena capillaripes]
MNCKPHGGRPDTYIRHHIEIKRSTHLEECVEDVDVEVGVEVKQYRKKEREMEREGEEECGWRRKENISIWTLALRMRPSKPSQASTKETSVKGKGLVATRDIKQGELVIQEPPLFTVPKSDEVALAIVQTSAAEAGDRVGMFLHMARFNHGCSSAINIIYSWRQREQQLFVHALRNIQEVEVRLPGPHLRFVLIKVGIGHDVRGHQAYERRTKYYRRLAAWENNTVSGVEAISTINKIWNLEDEEGYWIERGRLAAEIAAPHSE